MKNASYLGACGYVKMSRWISSSGATSFSMAGGAFAFFSLARSHPWHLSSTARTFGSLRDFCRPIDSEYAGYISMNLCTLCAVIAPPKIACTSLNRRIPASDMHAACEAPASDCIASPAELLTSIPASAGELPIPDCGASSAELLAPGCVAFGKSSFRTSSSLGCCSDLSDRPYALGMLGCGCKLTMNPSLLPEMGILSGLMSQTGHLSWSDDCMKHPLVLDRTRSCLCLYTSSGPEINVAAASGVVSVFRLGIVIPASVSACRVPSWIFVCMMESLAHAIFLSLRFRSLTRDGSGVIDCVAAVSIMDRIAGRRVRQGTRDKSASVSLCVRCDAEYWSSSFLSTETLSLVRAP